MFIELVKLAEDSSRLWNMEHKLEWAELNQAETVRLQVYAKLRFQV